MFKDLSKSDKRILIFAIVSTLIVVSITAFIYISDMDISIDIDTNKPKYIGSTKTVSNLSHDGHESNTNIIYVRENDDYVPYIVLTNYYNNKTLLLRQYVLNEKRVINNYFSYYPSSSVDRFLNNVFIFFFTDLKDKIVDSDITVLSRSAINNETLETETVSRKVFLLSTTELDLDDVDIEGTPLSYFLDRENRIAYNGSEKAQWWLRTPDTADKNVTYSINGNNVVIAEESDKELYVRPAFCVDPSLKIRQRTDIQNRKKLWTFVVD